MVDKKLRAKEASKRSYKLKKENLLLLEEKRIEKYVIPKEFFNLKDLMDYTILKLTYVRDRINEEVILLETGETVKFNIKYTYEMK